MFPNIEISEIKIETFRLMVGLGFLMMTLLILFFIKKEKLKSDEENGILFGYVFSIVIGFIFAVLLDSIFKIPEKGYFEIQGMTFYGGLIGAILGFYVFAKVFWKKSLKRNVIYYYNLLTVPFVVFHIFGRIGCFLAGCCHGGVTDFFLGIHFPGNSPAALQYGDVRVWPTQLFEVFLLLIILGVMFIIKKDKRFIWYLCIYAIGRFCIEFLRGDDRGEVLKSIFSPAQMISLLILAILTSVFIYKNHKYKCID